MEDTKIAVVGGRFSLDGHKLIDFTVTNDSSTATSAPQTTQEGVAGIDVQTGATETTHTARPQQKPIPVKQGRSKITISNHNFLKLAVTVSAPDVDEFRGGHLIVKTKYQVRIMVACQNLSS